MLKSLPVEESKLIEAIYENSKITNRHIHNLLVHVREVKSLIKEHNKHPKEEESQVESQADSPSKAKRARKK